MMAKLNMFVIVIITIVYNNVNCWKVTLFDQANFKGESIDVEGNYCVSIGNKNFDDKASSANTHNTCIRLYDKCNCRGKSIIIKPGSPSHDNLAALGFDNKAKSVSTCSNIANDIPPEQWKEHFDGPHEEKHNDLLTRVFYDNEVVVYFDKRVDKSITWMNKFLHDAWVHTKKVYGSFGDDPRLFAVFHSSKHRYSTAISYFDSSMEFKNTIDVNHGALKSGSGNVLDLVLHEISHIVEFAFNDTFLSPARAIWGDSKFAEIYIYDVFKALNRVEDVKRWHDLQMTNGKWFKEWLLPIYEKYGGSSVLNEFFKLVSQHFPKQIGTCSKWYTRDMNHGEFFHFWSGAAKANLKGFATNAFGWSDAYGRQFEQARKDFPNIKYPI